MVSHRGNARHSYDRSVRSSVGHAGRELAPLEARAAAERHDATLHVLYVVDAEARSSSPGDEFEGLEHALEEAGRDAVEAIPDRAAEAGADTEHGIRHGVPHEEMLASVSEADVGLTLVGSKNRPGEYRRLPGSVAERVARHSERPVTVVKTPVEAA